jgi:hypothetical protein
MSAGLAAAQDRIARKSYVMRPTRPPRSNVVPHRGALSEAEREIPHRQRKAAAKSQMVFCGGASVIARWILIGAFSFAKPVATPHQVRGRLFPENYVKQLTVMTAATGRLKFQFSSNVSAPSPSGGANTGDRAIGPADAPRQGSIAILYLRTIVRAARSGQGAGPFNPEGGLP